MDSKELEIQRALGTIELYWLTIDFPNREEPIGLDQLMATIIPTAERYYGYSATTFSIEAAPPHIQTLIGKLAIALKNIHPCSDYKAVVSVFIDASNEMIIYEVIK